MAPNQFDIEDVPAWGALVLSVVSLTGIGTISLFGQSLGGEATQLLGESVTWDALGVLAGAIAIMITNGIDLNGFLNLVQGDRGVTMSNDAMGTIAQLAVAAVVAVPILMVYVPEVADAVTTSDPIGATVAGLVVAGAGFSAYEA